MSSSSDYVPLHDLEAAKVEVENDFDNEDTLNNHNLSSSSSTTALTALEEGEDDQHTDNPWKELPPAYYPPIAPTARLLQPTDPNAPQYQLTTFQDRIVTFDPRLNRPSDLQTFVTQESQKPPRLLIRVEGYHIERRATRDKDEVVSVRDFDLYVDLTKHIARAGGGQFNTQAARDEQVAYRGGRWKEMDKALACGGAETSPTVEDWIKRYCEDPALLKSFTYNKRIVDIDTSRLDAGITNAVRATGYSGTLLITFPSDKTSIEVLSDHWIQRARRNQFILFLMFISMAWVLIWPVLWWFTHRYEVVWTRWYLARWDGRNSEDELLATYAPVVKRMALARKVGLVTEAEMESGTEVEPLPNGAVNAAQDLVRTAADISPQLDTVGGGWGHHAT
ncbi:hypothetical protein DFJ77DRAFT_546393 [Powellomyces hirtus]|nr:hypothetical protein DFJ77DRAFT_546393 [Powellomyces hirtus]